MRYRTFLLASALTVGAAHAAAAQEVDWSGELGQHPGTSLNIISITDPFIESLRAVKDGFSEITGAEVTVDGLGYDSLHEKEVLSCSQNDSTYDIMFVDGIWIGELVEAGCLDPVGDRFDADDPLIAWDDYAPGAQVQASWEGQRWCLPTAIYWNLMYYRTDLFEQAGREPPTTFEEVLETAKFFTDNPDFPGVYGYAMNNKRGAAAGQQFFEWIFSAGGKPWASNHPGTEDAYADLTPTFNAPEGVALVQFFKDMVAYGPPGVESFAWDERANAFASGQVAMINDWSVRAQIVDDPETSRIAGKFGSVLMPAKAGHAAVPPVGGWIMCVNAHGENKEAAWDFMKWFGSPEVHKEFALAGGPPSRTSALTDADVRARFPWTEALYKSSQKDWPENRPRHPLTFQLIDALGIEINRAIIGELTPQAALDQANANITEMLEDAGMLN